MDQLDLVNPRPIENFKEHQLASDSVKDLFAAESDHMPTFDSSLLRSFAAVRPQAVSLVLQAQFSCTLDPFISYVAVNYMDRFISKREFPQNRPWIVRLIVLSCLSLAAKMKNTEISLSQIQQGREWGSLIFDSRTIQRMELLILGALNWRMRAVTPFSFLCFFISLFDCDDPSSTQPLNLIKHRSVQLIFRALHEIKLLEFKPSIIAAASLLSACQELFPLHLACFRKALSCCKYVNKEKLRECLGAMQEMMAREAKEYEMDTWSGEKTPAIVVDWVRETTKRQRFFCGDEAAVQQQLREIEIGQWT